MKRILFLFFVVMGVSFSSALRAEIVLYCQSELANGFYNNDGTWQEDMFKKKRFTVKFNDDYSTLKGASYAPMQCLTPFAHIPNLISCIEQKFPYQPFLYDKNKKRFIFVKLSSGGYVVNGKDTDEMYAGTCENF